MLLGRRAYALGNTIGKLMGFSKVPAISGNVPSHQLRHFGSRRGGGVVKALLHSAGDTFAGKRCFEFAADRFVLVAIRNGAAALVEVDRAVILELLAGQTGLARTLIVGTVPGGDSQTLAANP